MAHQEALRKLKGMMEVLTDDVNEFMEMAIVPDKIIPFSATRAYVRAVFALVEGVSFAFRQLAASLPETEHCLSHGELAVLNDESYGVKDNVRFLPLLGLLRFTPVPDSPSVFANEFMRFKLRLIMAPKVGIRL